MWKVVRRNVFYERTFHFNKEKMDEIRSTCKDVCSLKNGRWKSDDPKSRKNHLHTLDLARAGEIAVYTVLKQSYNVGKPDFALRKGYDYGDIPIYTGTDTLWVEVKTATNRKGAHNKRNVNRVARELGYTFQRLIWNKWKKKMVLTPTFNPRSPFHERANKNS